MSRGATVGLRLVITRKRSLRRIRSVRQTQLRDDGELRDVRRKTSGACGDRAASGCTA
jgi:hypothetical protein